MVAWESFALIQRRIWIGAAIGVRNIECRPFGSPFPAFQLPIVRTAAARAASCDSAVFGRAVLRRHKSCFLGVFAAGKTEPLIATFMNTKKQKGAETSIFREFFIDQIKDIYWAEKHLIQGLKKMRKAATSPSLASAFEKHITESEVQMKRLERVFELLDEAPRTKKCMAMEGILAEADEVIGDTEKDSYTRDAGLILAAQKAEHYEIASYGTLAEFARMMGESKIAKELCNTLKEEEATDSLLTCLAEDEVNEMAVAE